MPDCNGLIRIQLLYVIINNLQTKTNESEKHFYSDLGNPYTARDFLLFDGRHDCL